MVSGVQSHAATTHNPTGDSLLLLLGLPARGNVLVVGGGMSPWCSYFQHSSFAERISGIAGTTAPHDLIIYHSASAGSRRELYSDLEQVRRMLSPGGSLLLFAENPCSYRRLKGVARGRLGTLAGRVWHRRSGYQKALAQAGFATTRCFLPLPVLEQPEELVVPGSRTMELPTHLNPMQRLIAWLTGPLALADGFVFCGGSRPMESSSLVQAVNAALSRQLPVPVADCVVERMDIRLRGAFVLFLRENNTGTGFIARMVSDPRIDEIVGKNHAFLEYLQTGAGLPTDVTTRLPRPVCRLEFGGSAVYVETMVSGMPAWKICHGDLRQQVFADAVGFLREIHVASRHDQILTRGILHDLFADDLARLAHCTAITSDFHEQLQALIKLLCDRLEGVAMALVISHGDYGYGNILVDPQSGVMQGVIDWDTGKKSDFPGVDAINLLVQKERAERCCAVLPAFASLIGSNGADAMAGCRSVLDQLEIPEHLHSCIVYLGFLRYVTRAAQYPKVFQREQQDYLAILTLLMERLPL